MLIYLSGDDVSSSALRDLSVQDSGVYGNKRRYGVTDGAVATRYGYHLPSTVERAKDRDKRAAPERTRALSFLVALNGSERVIELNGRVLPGGGCVADARGGGQ
ncbi:hypothetical protein [Streptomyces sp. NPDC006285]|uniref:hypothetical protein n=1 Tax=Streptomyces sp. NPDC006285 TaxID=3364742 RepID=UPI00368636CF